jgi:hypothetical protein
MIFTKKTSKEEETKEETNSDDYGDDIDTEEIDLADDL